MNTKILSGLAFLIAAFMLPTLASAQQQLLGVCGSLDNAYGPYDYRVDKKQLVIVERFHFDSNVESLTKAHSGTLGGDLDYTLRASPNHHRALMAMIKYGLREKTSKVVGANYSVECYLIRAEEFRPDDAMVKVIYGLYYLYNKKNEQAVTKLQEARKLDSRNANINYNLGLAYFELKRYEESLEMAHSAYALGFPLPGLRNKLKSAGKWRDPAPQPQQATPQAPSKPPALVQQQDEADAPDSTDSPSEAQPDPLPEDARQGEELHDSAQ